MLMFEACTDRNILNLISKGLGMFYMKIHSLSGILCNSDLTS